MLGENSITASIVPPLIPFTDIKLVFDFCVDAHCFGDIYAKVLSVEEKDGENRPSASDHRPSIQKTGTSWIDG